MSYKILLVDDDQDLVEMLCRYFRLKGYEMLTAVNGLDAVKKSGEGPDLILLDINMPGMDGLEVCRRIRDQVSCPILFLTARVEEQDRVNGLMMGGDDYIVKPFSLKELEARVLAHLRREERHQQKTQYRFGNGMMVDYTAKTASFDGQVLDLTKTTLMRVLTTVLTPSDGEVYLDGIRYGTGKDEVIRQKIGYLPQELNLYPGLSVQDCLEYLGELSGIPKEECKKRIRYYLEKTGLTNHRKKKMRQLSGGMKRRVGLIQALLNEPEFLIVDEPTTGLDPEERVRIRNLLVDFSEGRTVLFSTHVVEDIAATCSKLAVMRKGSFLYTGTVQALLSRAKGKIWTANVADDTEAKRLEKQYRTTSRQYTEEGMTVKIISDVKPDIDCTQPKITLEDAYLYLMMEKKKQ